MAHSPTKAKCEGGESSPPPRAGDEGSHWRAEGRIAWLQVAGAFSLNFNTWGIMSAYGVYQTYYSGELLANDSQSAIAWIGSAQAFLMLLLSFFIGPLFDRGHLRLLLWTGSVCEVIGCILLSFCTQYWQCFLAQGVLMGFGFGCLYLPAPALISMHFERRLSLAMGVASSASGLGAIIFPIVFTQLQPRIGFGWATRTIALLLLVSATVPLTVMRFPVETAASSHERPESVTETPVTATPSRWWISVLHETVDRTALVDRPYILLNGGLITGYMGLYVALFYINLFALQQTSASTVLSSNMLIIVNTGSALGRIAPSAVADVIGPINVLALTSAAAALLAFCLLAVTDAAGIVIWSVVFGAMGGAFMGLPAAGIVSASVDKSRIGARIGMTLGIVSAGVLVAEPIAGAILDGMSRWKGLISWCGTLLVVSAACMVTSRLAKTGLHLKGIA